MQSVSGCEYSQSNLIGHGAFALVFRGRKKKVNSLIWLWRVPLWGDGKLSACFAISVCQLMCLKNLQQAGGHCISQVFATV